MLSLHARSRGSGRQRPPGQKSGRRRRSHGHDRSPGPGAAPTATTAPPVPRAAPGAAPSAPAPATAPASCGAPAGGATSAGEAERASRQPRWRTRDDVRLRLAEERDAACEGRYSYIPPQNLTSHEPSHPPLPPEQCWVEQFVSRLLEKFSQPGLRHPVSIVPGGTGGAPASERGS